MIRCCRFWVMDSRSPRTCLLSSSTNTFLALKALVHQPRPPSSLTPRSIQPTGSILFSLLSFSHHSYSPPLPFSLLHRWMLEKYDGVRAFWNPETKSFYTRTGLKKNMPQEIIDSMPNIFLDGELWYSLPKNTTCTHAYTSLTRSLSTHSLTQVW